MKKEIKIFVGLIAFLLFFSSSIAAADGLTPDSPQIKKALDYLYSCQRYDGGFGEQGEGSDFQLTLRAIMAISAAGEDPQNWKKNNISPIDYLKNHIRELSSIGEGTPCRGAYLPFFILTLIASKNDAKNFDGINYIEMLKEGYIDGQYANPEFLHDDAWAVLALSHYNETIEIEKSVNFIKKNQNQDGAWGYGTDHHSDPDTSALVIMTLIAAGENEGSLVMQKALNRFHKKDYLRLPFGQNAATFSWVIQAGIAAKKDLASWQEGKDLIETLLQHQLPDGSFTWRKTTLLHPCWSTADAIPALLLKPYPITPPPEFSTKIRTGGKEIPIVEHLAEVTVDVRIEGKKKTIWEGVITVGSYSFVNEKNEIRHVDHPTALGAAIEAVKNAGLSYKSKTKYGDFIASIDRERGHWNYKINYRTCEVCPRLYNNGDSILWYHGPFHSKPLRVNVSSIDPVEKKVLVKVEAYETTEDKWYPVKNVRIYDGSRSLAKTDKQGLAEFVLEEGNYTIYAEKPGYGYVRSEKIDVSMPKN